MLGCGQVNAQSKGTSAGDSPSEAVTVSTGRLTRALRVGGTTSAVHSFTVTIPRIRGQDSNFTVVTIVPNGAMVKKGDVLVQFDATQQTQSALDAKAKYDGLVHQVADMTAQDSANAETRSEALQQAQSDFGTAQLELKKAPILSSIDADTDRINVQDAAAHIASLTKMNAEQAKADAAGLRVLELERDQSKLLWERTEETVEAMTMKAPLSGMVGLVPIRRADSQGPAQPGDQLFRGQQLLRIFDPGDMQVDALINEADGATLAPGLKGTLHLDAYPGVSLPVHFVNASPVAVAGGFGSSNRTFSATFHVDAQDRRLLPDLSAAIDLEVTSPAPQLLAPRAAIHFQGQVPYVSKRGRNGAWTEQAVELGNFDNQQVEILSGLAAGDQVRVPLSASGYGEMGGGQ